MKIYPRFNPQKLHTEVIQSFVSRLHTPTREKKKNSIDIFFVLRISVNPPEQRRKRQNNTLSPLHSPSCAFFHLIRAFHLLKTERGDESYVYYRSTEKQRAGDTSRARNYAMTHNNATDSTKILQLHAAEKQQ